MIKILFAIAILTWGGNAPHDALNTIGYCKMNYPQHEIVITDYDSIPKDRKDCGKVYVERIVSTSSGDHGTTADDYYIAYNKDVPKGETVVSYAVFNPYTNYCDDVVQVFDNNMSR